MVETPKLKPSRMEGNGMFYLRVAGSAGGPSIYTEIIGYKNGKQVEHFTALFYQDQVEGSSLNGRDLSKEECEAYIQKLPESKEITAFFRDF